MTEKTELTWEQEAALEQQKAEKEAAEKQEAGIRRLVRIQQEEQAKRDLEFKIKNIGTLSNDEFRKLKAQWGF